MRKGVRVFAAGVLLIVLVSSSTAFAASRGSQDVSLFARFLAWVHSRISPPIGAPTPNSRWSPPGGAPAPEPEPEPQSRFHPPIGVTGTPPATRP